MDIIKLIQDMPIKAKGSKYIIDVANEPKNTFFIIQYYFDESGAIIYSYLESVFLSETTPESRKGLLKQYLPSMKNVNTKL